jgi:hypothetical protein
VRSRSARQLSPTRGRTHRTDRRGTSRQVRSLAVRNEAASHAGKFQQLPHNGSQRIMAETFDGDHGRPSLNDRGRSRAAWRAEPHATIDRCNQSRATELPDSVMPVADVNRSAGSGLARLAAGCGAPATRVQLHVASVDKVSRSMTRRRRCPAPLESCCAVSPSTPTTSQPMRGAG